MAFMVYFINVNRFRFLISNTYLLVYLILSASNCNEELGNQMRCILDEHLLQPLGLRGILLGSFEEIVVVDNLDEELPLA